MRGLLTILLVVGALIACGGKIDRDPEPSDAGAEDAGTACSRPDGEVYAIVREDVLSHEPGRTVVVFCETAADELITGRCEYRKGSPAREFSAPIDVPLLGSGWSCAGDGDPLVEVSAFALCRARC